MALSCQLANRILLLATLFTVSCAEVAPTNPFDPSTPAAQQAKATVHGFVALPPGYPPGRFGGAGIDLVGLGDASASGQMGALAPGPVVAGEVSSAPFTFEGVPVGRYTLRARIEGFTVAELPLDVGIAEDVDVGTLRATLSGTSAIEGIATFEPAPPDGHSGIVVEISGSPGTTQTNSTGAYRLILGAGTYTVTFTATGYDRVQLADQRVDEGQVLIAPPVALKAKPATVTGRVLRTAADGALVPAEAANVTIAAVEPGAVPVDQTSTDASGAFRMEGFPGGAYVVTATLAGHAPVSRDAPTRFGETLPLGDLVLDLERGTISGAVSRASAEGQGGATIRASRRAAPPFDVEVIVRTAIAAAPDDAFSLVGLPAGTYDLVALAEGFRPGGTDPAEPIVVAANQTVSFRDTLAARVHTLTAAPVTKTSPVTVQLVEDADLTFARVWADSLQPPEALDFMPLPADGQVAVPLEAEGAHVVYAQLATAAQVNQTPETAHLRAISPVLSAAVFKDTVAPELAVRHVPAGAAAAGFVIEGEVSNFELAGFDPLPASGLESVHIV